MSEQIPSSRRSLRTSATIAQESGEEPRGLVCPKCGCRHFYVNDTYRRNGFIMRRRQCRHCGRKVTTRETTIGET